MKKVSFFLSILISWVSFNVNLGIVSGGWTTPDSAYGCDNLTVEYAIDDNLNQGWSHSSEESHWSVYDMGDVYTITHLRFYTNPENDWDVCRASEIYVSNDTSFSGETLGDCVLSGSSRDWYVCDHTDANGQYVKVVYYTYETDTCEPDVNLGFLWEMDVNTTEEDTIDEFKICFKLFEYSKDNIYCKIQNQVELERCEMLENNLCQFDDNTHGLVVEL